MTVPPSVMSMALPVLPLIVPVPEFVTLAAASRVWTPSAPPMIKPEVKTLAPAVPPR